MGRRGHRMATADVYGTLKTSLRSAACERSASPAEDLGQQRLGRLEDQFDDGPV